MQLNALFRLGFPSASSNDLTSLHSITRHIIMQKARDHPGRTIGLSLLVGTRFQVSFTPLTGVLFTFPSRYSFTIGRSGVFRLGEWSPQVPTGLLVPCGTQVLARPLVDFAYRTFTLFGRLFHAGSAI